MNWIDDRAQAPDWSRSAVVQLINPDRPILGGDLPDCVLSAFKDRLELTRFDVPERPPPRKPEVVVSDILGETDRSIAATAARWRISFFREFDRLTTIIV